MNVDTSFTAQINVVTGFAVCAALLLASIKYSHRIRHAMRLFAYSRLLMGCGFLVVAFRGALAPGNPAPDWAPLPPAWPSVMALALISVANGIAVAAVSLNYVSIRHLQGKPVPRHTALISGAGLSVACFVALLLGPPDLVLVRVLSSVVMIVFLVLTSAELLLLYDGRGIAQYTAGAVTLLVAVAVLARIGAALTQPAVPIDQIANDRIEQTVFLLGFLGTVVGTINFMLMAGDEFNKELAKLANTDGLTGVLNRRRFLELAETEFRRAHRYGRPLSVLIIDIDRFKTINDRAGHPFGDRVIRAVADCCSAQLREGDAVGRLGGEEFAILLPEKGPESGARTAETLRAAIERDVAALAAERGLTVTCSIGGVALDRGHACFADLIAQSDAALYQAKDAGRNRVHFARSAVALAAHA